MTDSAAAATGSQQQTIHNLTVAEQLMYSTVRLETPETGGAGTGFFFAFFKQGDVSLPAIVTNKHVLKDADIVDFRLTKAKSDKTPDTGNFHKIRIANLKARAVSHPDADLAAFAITDVIDDLVKQGSPPFIVSLEQSLIPTDQELKQLSPLEAVVTVGYPGQLWDHVNNLPLFHRGNTATAPYIYFQGRKEFLVDFATWPGASGSPLFVFNEGGFIDRSGSLSLGGSRLLLVGVVYGVGVQEVTGKVVIQQAPTTFSPTPLISSSNVPTNLGACLQASRILEVEQLFVRFGFTPPPGYVPRAGP